MDSLFIDYVVSSLECLCPNQEKSLTSAYFVICPFSIDYESVMFYSTGPWCQRIELFLFATLTPYKIS
jgi:hypothetical protein